MKQVRSDLVCCIGHVLPLLFMLVLCEGVFLARDGGGFAFAFAVQPHREVRPESGLVGIVEHIVVNKR